MGSQSMGGSQPWRSQNSRGSLPISVLSMGGSQAWSSQTSGGSLPMGSQSMGGSQPWRSQTSEGSVPVRSQAMGGSLPLRSRAMGGSAPLNSRQSSGGSQTWQGQLTGGSLPGYDQTSRSSSQFSQALGGNAGTQTLGDRLRGRRSLPPLGDRPTATLGPPRPVLGDRRLANRPAGISAVRDDFAPRPRRIFTGIGTTTGPERRSLSPRRPSSGENATWINPFASRAASSQTRSAATATRGRSQPIRGRQAAVEFTAAGGGSVPHLTGSGSRQPRRGKSGQPGGAGLPGVRDGYPGAGVKQPDLGAGRAQPGADCGQLRGGGGGRRGRPSGLPPSSGGSTKRVGERMATAAARQAKADPTKAIVLIFLMVKTNFYVCY